MRMTKVKAAIAAVLIVLSVPAMAHADKKVNPVDYPAPTQAEGIRWN